MDEIKRLTTPDTVDWRAIFLRWLVWVVWLPFLVAPITTLFQSSPSPLRLAVVLGGVLLFVAIYIWTAWQLARMVATGTLPASPSGGIRRWFPWPSIVIMAVLCLALVRGDASGWGEMFYYISACVGAVLPVLAAVAGIVGLDLLIFSGIWWDGLDWSFAAQVAGLVTIIGVVLMSTIRSTVTGRELRAAREEIVYLAVAAERLRIARDLHDLLGRSLSLIALKSELAGRLVISSPERAAGEIGDIEQAARQALQEVREAVTGYRRPTLASELHDARGLLAAAGIACSYDLDERLIRALPASVEAVLSWTVREGVTNIIRHSRARRCTIRVVEQLQEIQVEITDDGPLAVPDPSTDTTVSTAGNGLRGLAERVEGLGGRYEAGPCGGGFRLAVAVPIEHEQRG
jgi:two-component system, NarL family, sensor histidine kinase DesK